MNSIPKILHQTWKDDNIPSHFVTLISTWKENHPDWEYNLWTDDTNRSFILNNYPEFLTTYDSYSNNIQRVDAVRYFILYHYGGVFIDIDFECFKNINLLLDGSSCVFALEPEEHAGQFNKPYIVCNAFMACISKNDFFKRLCSDLADVQLKKINDKIDILQTTGPFFLTDIYNNYTDKENITLLSSSLIYPFSIAEVRKALKGEINKNMQLKLNNAFALHYFWGNWWKEVSNS
jgi:mannosyltransferase OCH1-like enzyme